MRKQRKRALSLAVVGAVVVLTGCTATHPSALRINSDGSVDYVTCFSDADDWYAVSYESEDQEKAIELRSTEELGSSLAGSVVNFASPGHEWHSIIVGASYSSEVRIRSGDFTVGEWRWNTDGWFKTGARCSIEE